ncbi:hypothetical protein [Rhizocola hellebori]|nr:hypothetical protein [Rhizocola hellebori]
MDMLWLLRFGAVCGVVLGLSLGVPAAVEAFTGETAATSFVIGLGTAFGAPALTAIYLRHRRAAGSFGAIAYAVNLIGLGLFSGVGFTLNLALFYLDPAVVEDLLAGPTRFAFLGSAVVFVVGTVLFGVSLLRAGVFAKVPSLGYAGTLSLLALLAPLPDSVFTSGVHVLAGASLVWLSWSVWQADEPLPARP